MLTKYLQKMLESKLLSRDEAEAATEIFLNESCDAHQISAFLLLIKQRGETALEIAGMASAIQKQASFIPQFPADTLDIVGTGGDMSNTVNISTGSAILAAACGIPIVKHGNRSVSSRCGSADLLEAWGINIEPPPLSLPKQLAAINIAFMYAPVYYPILKRLSSIRKGLKIPTILNMLGPLLNPAKSAYALIGVANVTALPLMAKAVQELGQVKRGLIFHGSGLDELTSLGPITAYKLEEDKLSCLQIDPEEFGFARCSLLDLQGGSAHENGIRLRAVFSGVKNPLADSLVLNAGAALWIFGKVTTLQQGIIKAKNVLEKGAALRLLDKWISLSQQRKKELFDDQG